MTFLLFSYSCFAGPEKKDFTQLMNNYFDYVLQEDEEKLQTILSQEYYQHLKKTKSLEPIYEKNRKNKPDPKNRKFDLTYQKASVDKDLYFVNIKDPKASDFDDQWYEVRVQKNKKLKIMKVRIIDN